MTPAEFATSGMWMSNHLNIATYVSLADDSSELANPDTRGVNLFNPTALDFDEYASWAARVGAVGAILTAKHVDGFCLWPSAVNVGGFKRTVAQSTWYLLDSQRNVLLEFTRALRRRGLMVGYYFCAWDKFRQNLDDGTPSGVGIVPYTAWTIGQLNEILDADIYGDIKCIIIDGYGGTWFPDGPTFDNIDYDQVYAAIKAKQPGCVVIINNHETGEGVPRHGDISLWERQTDQEPLQGSITNFTGGALWDPSQFNLSANEIAWFDHTDGATTTYESARVPIGRRYRMARLVNPPVTYILNASQYLDGKLATDTKALLSAFEIDRGPLIAQDSFILTGSEVELQTLETHTSADGHTWSTDYHPTQDPKISPDGFLRLNDPANQGTSSVMNYTPLSADYAVELDYTIKTAVPNPFELGVRLRATDATHDNRFIATWNGTTFVMGLRMHDGSLHTIGTDNSTVAADNPTVGKNYRLRIKKVGTFLTGQFWIDNAGDGNYLLWGAISGDEPARTAVGKPGLLIANAASTSTSGVQIMDFRVYDFAAGRSGIGSRNNGVMGISIFG